MKWVRDEEGVLGEGGRDSGRRLLTYRTHSCGLFMTVVWVLKGRTE